MTKVKSENEHSDTTIVIKYKECMRNHAASIGGHANDGCGEFMPRSQLDGTRESLTCAACGCHRNFHRREVPSGVHQHHRHHVLYSPMLSPPPHAQQPMLLYNAGPTKPMWEKKMIGAVDLHDHDHGNDVEKNHDHDRRSETPDQREEVQVDHTGAAMRSKRSRTKFTQEQKDRLLEFAERIGWKIQGHDDVAINQFCLEVGVKRNVLKVWMHNNKNAHRRREAAPPPPPQPIIGADELHLA